MRVGGVQYAADCVWNVTAHAQKPDFVFRAKRTSPFKSARWAGRQFSGLLRSRGVRISGSNAGYTMFRGSVKGTGYPMHSSVSPSLPLPCVTVCHHISTGLYLSCQCLVWRWPRAGRSGDRLPMGIKSFSTRPDWSWGPTQSHVLLKGYRATVKVKAVEVMFS